VRDRLSLENDLRRAVAGNDFEVHYQPIVALTTGMCVGFESLVRWTRNGEPVSPVTFVPIAEELGLIDQLGTWVLQQACRTFANWQRQYPGAGLDCITVNVSSRQLVQQNFLRVVQQAVLDTGMRPADLRVEITEAQVQRATARGEGAKVALLQAGNDLRRSEQLAKQGFIAPNKLESDRLAALAAQKELDAANQERHVAGHEVEQARAALMAVRGSGLAGARGFTVRAPTAGRVLRIAQASETVVTLGMPLLEVGDTQSLEVVAELLTSDALQARPGARVLIERWGGSVPLEGRVRLVEPSAFTKVSALGVEEQRVKVLIDITSPSAQWAALGDGFRVGVRIVTIVVEDAVKVPASAVFPLPQGSNDSVGGMAAFVVENGLARLVSVEIGARNASDAWVRRGLSAGATVIVYPPPAMKDGLRVKQRSVQSAA